MLNDYLRLLDSLDDKQALAESAEPMTVWIGLMQAAARPSADAAQRADVQRLARRHWGQDGDVAWLMPLVAEARQLREIAPDELKALRGVLPRRRPGRRSTGIWRAWRSFRVKAASGPGHRRRPGRWWWPGAEHPQPLAATEARQRENG